MSINAPDPRPALVKFAILLAGAILNFLFLIVAVTEFGWLFKAPISSVALPVAFAGSCMGTAVAARALFEKRGRATLLAVAILAAMTVASAVISMRFYDVSFDGQAYHQEGVYQLAHGWNPLFTPYISPISIDQDVKLIHFPKGPWVIAASMYRLTGHIESGKFANLLLIVVAFCVALGVFASLEAKLGFRPFILAALAAASPVAVCQILTFYVDGQMASLLVCLAGLCFLSTTNRNWWVSLMLSEAAILLIQIKFTGLVYVILVLAGFLVLLMWQKRPWRRFVAMVLLTVSLGTFVFGKNPYVSNTFENGHPFYPFFGTGDFPKISMDATTPPQFFHHNRLVNLALSIFCRSYEWPPEAELKVPWKADRAEWNAFEEPDALVGGFGPLFAAALLMALAILGSARRQWPESRIAIAVIVIVVGSVLPVSACWWARYAPQIWVIPLIAITPVGKAESRNLRLASWAVLLILIVNVAGIAWFNFRANVKATRETAESLDDLRLHAPFKASFGLFRSNRFRLQEAGIPFVEDEGHLTCDPEVKENDDLCIER